MLGRDEWHGVVHHAVGVAGVEERHNMWVLHPGDGLDLPAESVAAHDGRELREHLDGDASAQRNLGGREDPAHASASEFALDAVGVRHRLLQAALEVHGREGRPPSRASQASLKP